MMVLIGVGVVTADADVVEHDPDDVGVDGFDPFGGVA